MKGRIAPSITKYSDETEAIEIQTGEVIVKNSLYTDVALSNKFRLVMSTAIAAIVMSPVAYAQDTPNDTAVDDDEIVTTGIRRALKDARDLKRAADTAVDSITASDVSTLPDLSVAEALQRVPGVTVQQFDLSDANGGDFPSPEGGNNLIRGLAFVRSEFNSRESFSANGGRALDFGTVPPELIGSVNVYKNTTADLTEGGIGGTIDLRTLEPFDKDGAFATITADGTYTDFRDEISPDFTVTAGNRWDGTRGEFGLLGGFSHSELKSRIDNFQVGAILPEVDVETPDGLQTLDTPIAIPAGYQLRFNEIDRERQSYYVAGQWQNHKDTFKATAKYFRIENLQERNENTHENFADAERTIDGGNRIVGDFTTTPFASDGLHVCGAGTAGFPNDSCVPTLATNGLFETGVISNSFRDWTGANGARAQNTAIDRNVDTTTDDLSLNVQWRPADKWFVNVDAHKTTSETDFNQVWGVNVFFADYSLNVANPENPEVTIIPTENNNPIRRFADGTVSTPWFGGAADPLSGDVSDPNNNFALALADEFQFNEGESWAIKGDVEYEFDDDNWFDSVKFGARVSEREQTNRQSGLNWNAISPPWGGRGVDFGQTHISVADTNIGFDAVDFSDFFGGGILSDQSQSVVLFTPRALLENYDELLSTVFNDPNFFLPNGANNFIGGVVENGSFTNPLTGQLGQFSGEFDPLRPNGVFRDDALTTSSVTEEVLNLYTRLDFGNEFENGMSLDGNVGLRYARAKVRGTGGRIFVDLEPGSDSFNFNPETAAFLNQADIDAFDEEFETQEHWLPSFNAKLNLNDESLIRLAASRNITRPRIDQLNSGQTFVGNFQFIVDDTQQPPITTDVVPFQISQFGGNPNLQPIESWNFDLGFEHYFGEDNFFAVTGFYKDITNNIIGTTEAVGFEELDGETLPVIFTTDRNEDSAEFLGVEVSYQHFFDELPGIWSNFGVQANYTYIDSSTNPPIPNIDTNGDGIFDASGPDGNGDGIPDSDLISRFNLDNFLGTSDHTANLIGIYQDERFEFRLAYNFRSEFLISRADFVTGNALFVEDDGIFDGSAKWDVNDNLQFRVQASNIFGSISEQTQQVDLAGQRLVRARVKGDRRIKFGLRYNF